MPKAKPFPKTLFVRREVDVDATYFTADAALPVTDDTEPCAVYQLVSVGRVKVQRTFEK